MLRQVFLYYKGKRIFSYFFAKAFDNTALDTLLNKRLLPYIQNPINGKIFNKPMFKFQAHFGMFNGVFFLFITDMADRPKTIAKEIERASKLFKKNFPEPQQIKETSQEKEEFTIFIKETHYFLHPKISLMGPVGAGKSTIRNILKINDMPDKRIMNFAEYYQIQLANLNFDLWDFVEPDDFSPLWNNFIRGSDIIFFVVNAERQNVIDRKIQFFINLKRREGKYSKWAIVLTKWDVNDTISKSDFQKRYNIEADIPIFELDFTSTTLKNDLDGIFSEGIGLKQALPPDFRKKLVTANNYVSEQKYQEAVDLLKELSVICTEYQEFSYLEVFQNKIADMESKIEEQKKQKARDQRKIKAPKKIQFGNFNAPKILEKGEKHNLPAVPSLSSLKRPAFPKKSINKMEQPSKPLSSTNITSLNQESLKLGEKEEELEGVNSSILQDISGSNPFFGNLPPSPAPSNVKLETNKEINVKDISKEGAKPTLPSIPSLPKISAIPKASEGEETPKIESKVDELFPKSEPMIDSSISAEIQTENPFFSNISQSQSENTEKKPEILPMDDFQIKTHQVQPINIERLENP
ncbi:MAG: GTPase domain-containing protein, partial [Promethearchaeota archaeon]